MLSCFRYLVATPNHWFANRFSFLIALVLPKRMQKLLFRNPAVSLYPISISGHLAILRTCCSQVKFIQVTPLFNRYLSDKNCFFRQFLSPNNIRRGQTYFGYQGVWIRKSHNCISSWITCNVIWSAFSDPSMHLPKTVLPPWEKLLICPRGFGITPKAFTCFTSRRKQGQYYTTRAS